VRCPEDQSELAIQDGAHVCLRCRGRFVDASQLPPAVAARLEMETLMKSGAFERTVSCPDCNTAMAPWRFGPAKAWLERCPRCHYFWLDPNDQRQLATARLSDDEQQALARAYVGSTPAAEASISPLHALLAWFGFPVLTKIERHRSPWVSWALAAILTLLFVGAFDAPYRAGSGTVFDAFTATFTHFGWAHLIGNVYFLMVFGDGVEQRLPRPLFALGFVVFGTLSILIDGLFEGAHTIIAGSSGAVAVIMGACIMLQPRARVTTRLVFTVVNVPIIAYGVIELGYQIFMWLIDVAGTAWVAHITGIGFGLMLGKVVAYFTVPREARVL
jgi:membrane associated rhomboid family serine protease